MHSASSASQSQQSSERRMMSPTPAPSENISFHNLGTSASSHSPATVHRSVSSYHQVSTVRSNPNQQTLENEIAEAADEFEILLAALYSGQGDPQAATKALLQRLQKIISSSSNPESSQTAHDFALRLLEIIQNTNSPQKNDVGR